MTTSFSRSCGHAPRPASPLARTRAPSDEGSPEPVPAPPGGVEAIAGGSLAVVLGEVTRSFHACSDLDALLAEVVATAVRLVPGAEHASLSLGAGQHVTSEHPTSELARDVDRLQVQVAEGPCLDVVRHEASVRVTDLGLEERWPAFTPQARRLGVRSILCSRLSVRERTLGALTLVSRRPGAFDDEARGLGLLLAGQAAVALASASKVEQLRRAVVSRDVIGQAKGMLMERYGCDQEHAFGVLTRVSQTSHRKLYDVAHGLVTTGRIEDLTTGGRRPG